jgi:putative transposase
MDFQPRYWEEQSKSLPIKYRLCIQDQLKRWDLHSVPIRSEVELCSNEKGQLTRHSEEQIIAILKQGEAGLPTAELCRQHGITEQTYYRWKAKYGGMDSGKAKRLKQLEYENRKLKHVVAELTRD